MTRSVRMRCVFPQPGRPGVHVTVRVSLGLALTGWRSPTLQILHTAPLMEVKG